MSSGTAGQGLIGGRAAYHSRRRWRRARSRSHKSLSKPRMAGSHAQQSGLARRRYPLWL